MTTATRRWGLLAAVVGGVLLVDQATKWLVVSRLAMFETVEIVPGLAPYFQVTRSFNTGAAFGLLGDVPFSGLLFLLIALCVVGFMLWQYPRVEGAAWGQRVATGLVVGGALGNAIDRLTHGHVVDFIHYEIPNVIANVSNLADHAIVFGVLFITVLLWRADETETAPTPAEAPGDYDG